MTASDKPELPLYVDSTMLTSFRACQRKYYYSFLHNLRPAGQSVHLVAGAAFAAGLEAGRRFAFSAGRGVTVDEILEAAWMPFAIEWGDYTPPEGAIKSFENTFAALEFYFREHHPQLDPIQPLRDEKGAPLLEFSFAIPLPVEHPSGDKFIFVGRFDMLGCWNDLPVIVDEKTTSALGGTWPRQFDLRGQFLGYSWACHQLGFNTNHVFVRGIAIRKNDFEVMTVPKQYPHWLLDRWFQETCKTLEQIKAHYLHDEFHFNFGDSCSSYGGCAFVPLCEAREPEQWYSTYEINKWSPIKGETP